jgi:stage II sporulation protein GA (sporulation sigma-E factor processing peptidase)
MATVVYVDVLIALNFIINFVLIWAAAKLVGVDLRPIRACAGALVGALGALSIFLPSMGVWTSGALKILFCLMMVAVACQSCRPMGLLRLMLSLLFVSFVAAGLMLALYLWLAPAGMIMHNGAVYFSIGALPLLLITGLCYGVVELISRWTRRRQAPGELCRLRMVRGGRSVSLVALLDTGNHLTEPFSGLPVVICAYGDVSPIMPETVAAYYGGETGVQSQPGLRMIPFRTIKGGGALPAFRPDRVLCSQSGGVAQPCDLYVAVTLDPVGDERYAAIANPAILSHYFERAGELV